MVVERGCDAVGPLLVCYTMMKKKKQLREGGDTHDLQKYIKTTKKARERRRDDVVLSDWSKLEWGFLVG